MKLLSTNFTKMLLLILLLFCIMVAGEQPTYPIPQEVTVPTLARYQVLLDSLRRSDRVKLFQIENACADYQLKPKK